MHYEEKCENGHWYWRGTPDGAWLPFTVEMLEQKAIRAEKMLKALLKIRDGYDGCTCTKAETCPHCVAARALAD